MKQSSVREEIGPGNEKICQLTTLEKYEKPNTKEFIERNSGHNPSNNIKEILKTAFGITKILCGPEYLIY